LIAEGYDKKTVMELPEDSELALSQEKPVTRDQETSDTGINDDAGPARASATCILYETFIPLALKGDGNVRSVPAGSCWWEAVRD
jgi:hypothetical protein